MAKPEWGKKRTCQNCGAKYYALQKDPPTCPKCDTVFQVEQTTRGRRRRATAEAPKAIPAAAAAAVNENSEVEVEDEVLDETDESIPEDTSDLVGDDDDDVGVVIDTGESKLDDN